MASINIKALLAHLTPFCKTGLESAAGACVTRSHYGITHEDLKAALSNILENFPTGNTAKPVFSPRLIDWYQHALLEGTVELNQTGIRSGTLFLAFLTHGQRLSSPGLTDLFADIEIKEIRHYFSDIIKPPLKRQKPAGPKPSPNPPSKNIAKTSRTRQNRATLIRCSAVTRRSARS